MSEVKDEYEDKTVGIRGGSSDNSLKDGIFTEVLSEHSSLEHDRWYSDDQLRNFMLKLGYRSSDVGDVPDDINYVLGKIPELSATEAVRILEQAIEYHDEDKNIPEEQKQEWLRLVTLGNSELQDHNDDFNLRAFAAVIKYHSPYQEVRAIVSPTDDPSIPVETFRAYFLAIVWSIVGSGFNEFFSHRVVTISVSTAVVQMLLYFCGTAWAKVVPTWGVTIKGKKYGINLKKPWSAKEQMFATLMFSISSGTFYTHLNILTLKVYYKEHLSFGYQFLLSLSIQFIGFGFAGILRRFVVYPSKALWPSSMPVLALNQALLGDQKKASRGITRYQFFFVTFGFMFTYNWLPTYIVNILNTFNWMTWIAPNNINLANITGGVTGIGINPIPTFDWNVVSYTNPLVNPFFSTFTQYIGSFLAAIIVIAVYYSNYMNCQYLPMFTNSLYTNTAKLFKVSNILDSNFKLDWNKYQSYSPPYFTAGNLVSYGSFICMYPLMIGWSFIIHSKILYTAFREWFFNLLALRKWQAWVALLKEDASALDSYDDAHSKMMRSYKEVPDWWYFAILIGSLIVGIVVIEEYQTNTPVWALFMSLGFNFVFLIPITILQATTGFSFGLNLLIEMIIGYALPGNPLALMVIKAFGYNIDGQADNYVSNLKLGHYAKVPPVALFKGQMLIVLIQIFVNLGVLNWQISNIKDFCEPHQNAKFTCPDAVTYYNASVVWGSVGPKRIFNDIYPIFKWCWLIGACIGVSFGLWRKFGRYYPKNFDPLLLVGGMLNLGPPYGLMYLTPGLFVSWVSQYYAKRHFLRAWEKYNYVLSASFSTGLVLSAIIIFFAVQYKDTSLSWWGNNVPYTGADGEGLPLLNVTDTPNGYFGIGPGSYP